VVACRLDDYLIAAASFARTQWTQFNMPLMAAGLALFATAISAQLALLWVRTLHRNCVARCLQRMRMRHWYKHKSMAEAKLQRVCTPPRLLSPHVHAMVISSTFDYSHFQHIPDHAQGVSPLAVSSESARHTETTSPAQAAPDALSRAAFTAAPLLHAGALFSNSFVLAEGRMLGFGLATLTALLTRSALLPPSLPHHQRQRRRQQQSSKPPAQQRAPKRDAVRASGSTSPEGECCCTVPHGKAALDPGDEGDTAKPPPDVVSGHHSFAEPQLAAADAAGRRRTAHVLATGAAALMLLWALGQRGLVVRSGHDAMWRTAAEHRTVPPPPDASAKAAGSWMAGAAAEYLPLIVLPWFLLRAKRRMMAECR